MLQPHLAATIAERSGIELMELCVGLVQFAEDLGFRVMKALQATRFGRGTRRAGTTRPERSSP